MNLSIGIGNEISRRDFIRITGLSAAGFLTGCAINPISGESQLMLVSEGQEIFIDRQNSPHQFSADYGKLQDKELNNYINQTGKMIASHTHRPNMPYSFGGVNAVYINAYAFPGGSIACTRGMLIEIENEAELAALLGHELVHVNARHTAQQMSKGLLVSAALGGIAAAVGTENRALGNLAAGLGNIGAGALLAKYSRDNEREADSVGMKYMVKSGYNPKGMEGLLDILRSKSKHEPGLFELMFATHPMSEERYQTAVSNISSNYQNTKNLPFYKERYMDNTARLRKIKDAIREMQEGGKAMSKKKYSEAEVNFEKALKKAPEDYAGLVMMAKCQYAQERYKAANRYAKKAQEVYPEEAQANYIGGMADIKVKNFESAYEQFNSYERLLKGNPNIIFLKGYSLEGIGRIRPAANEYHRYLNKVNEGNWARHAYRRLVEWGYVRRRRK